MTSTASTTGTSTDGSSTDQPYEVSQEEVDFLFETAASGDSLPLIKSLTRFGLGWYSYDIQRLTELSEKYGPLETNGDALISLLQTHEKGAVSVNEGMIAYLDEALDEYIKQLQKQRKSSGLQKFLKALGPIGMVIAAVAAFIAPSPLTIALLVVAVAMFLEPMISKAAGAESLIEQGMEEIFKGLKDTLGPVAAAVVAALLLILIVILATVAIAAGLTAASAATSTSTASAGATAQALTQFMKELPKLLGQAFTSSLDPAKTQQLQLFLEFAQGVILAVQAGIQIDVALINFEIAKLMRAFGVEQAVIDEWTKIIELVSKDLGGSQELIQFLQSLMPQLFDHGQGETQ